MSGDSSKLHEMTKAPRRLAQSGGVREPHALRRHPSPRPQHPNETPRDGKIRTSCMIRGVCAAKRSPSWQDLRAVYSRKAICRAFRIHSARILPKSAHFGCMAAICCQEGALFPSEAPFGIHEAQNLPRIAARERTAAESCHGKTPENASREYIATASQAKGASGRSPATAGRWETHLASILPPSNAGGTHQGTILPSPDARKHINEELA